MKILNSSFVFRLYSKTFLPKNVFRVVCLKHHRFLVCRYSSSASGISNSLLQNPGVRSYLDNLLSNDYSEAMSEPSVSTLICAIRSLKVDLQSLNEFDTGR